MININQINDYFKYLNEHKKYKKYTINLLWFKKYGRYAWVKGENFGDYLSKVIVAEAALKAGFKKSTISNRSLLAVGSILHFARNNDIVWGSGVNGKVSISKLQFTNLNVKAVREPLTKKILMEKGIKVQEVFGDPALLLPTFFPELTYKPIKNKIIMIPNLNEYKECKKLVPKNIILVSPYTFWIDILNEILTSEVVLTSSLHGLIISEAFNVPVYLFKPFGGETMFKYEDYVLGTNMDFKEVSKGFLDSVKIKSGTYFPSLNFNKIELLNSFPYEEFI